MVQVHINSLEYKVETPKVIIHSATLEYSANVYILNLDVEVASLGRLYGVIFYVWTAENTTYWSKEYTRTGRYTETVELPAFHSLRWGVETSPNVLHRIDVFYRTAFPIYEKVYEIPTIDNLDVRGYILSWDIDVTEISPYTSIKLIFWDSPEHGYVCTEWYSVGRQTGSFTSYNPLHHVTLTGDSENFWSITADKLPVYDVWIPAPPSPPSLTIEKVEPSWDGPVPPDEYVYINILVRNIGGEESGEWWARLIDDDTGELIDEKFMPSLLPNEADTARFEAYAKDWVKNTVRNMRVEVGINDVTHDVSGCNP